MNPTAENLAKFIAALSTGRTRQLEFLLYAVRPTDAVPARTPDLSRWPANTTAWICQLHDDPWPIIIDLIEIDSPTLADDYQDLLLAALTQTLNQGALLAWYMYDGAFGDVTTLFSSAWQARQTYGIGWSQQPAQIAIPVEEPVPPAWMAVLTAAAEYLYGIYPELRTLYQSD